MIRNLLLWMSRNSWMGETLPKKSFMRRAVRRFMPGETRSEALQAAEGLRAGGIATVFTLLGENVVSREGVEEVVQEYLDLLEEAREAELDAEISIKLTQLGLDLGEEIALESLLTLVRRAKETGSFVWIDMEAFPYRETTLEIYRRAVEREGASEVGICLQAYLRASPQDLEDLLPLSPSIRFVKGAYAEPPEIAFPDRKSVDEAFFQLCARTLEGGGRSAFATHDATLVDRLKGWVGEQEIDPHRYEFQMLYGIRGDLQQGLARSGEPIRVLVSYGPAWFPWYMRRLAERPANVWFVVKNMVRPGGSRAGA